MYVLVVSLNWGMCGDLEAVLFFWMHECSWAIFMCCLMSSYLVLSA